MEIYLDLVVMLNFLVDFLLLLGTNRLSGFPPGGKRAALGAALGAVYSGVCLLPGFRFLGNLLWRMVSLAGMAVTAFGLGRRAWKRCGIFLILAMALGGIAGSIGKGDFGTLALASAVVWLLCRVSFDGAVGAKEYVPVEICYGEKRVNLIALRDSGNTLRDPITGEQVLIIGEDAARALTGLNRQQLASPLETLTQRPVPGLRLIPYKAVGQGGSMLLGMRIDDVKIGSRRQRAIVAFAPEGLGRGEMVQALTGGVI